MYAYDYTVLNVENPTIYLAPKMSFLQGHGTAGEIGHLHRCFSHPFNVFAPVASLDGEKEGRSKTLKVSIEIVARNSLFLSPPRRGRGQC